MLTATLLDPRAASYQTELGKALYQTRSFGRALEVYDYAKTLDPKDPTPYFYKGIGLSDLNRPGEAIQEINKSIELNDNVAMFRSRSLLNQPGGAQLQPGQIYQQLGLNEWAYSKAVTAVKYYPHGSSAHLFLSDVIFGARASSEAPFLTGGLLFHREYGRGPFTGCCPTPTSRPSATSLWPGPSPWVSPWITRPCSRCLMAAPPFQGVSGPGKGENPSRTTRRCSTGGPGVAAAAYGRYSNSRGANWSTPPNVNLDTFSGTQQFYDIQGAAKWEPTVKGTLTGFLRYTDQKATSQGAYREPPEPDTLTAINNTFADSVMQREKRYEIAYYYRFNPQAASLVYYSRLHSPYHLVNPSAANTTIDAGAERPNLGSPPSPPPG